MHSLVYRYTHTVPKPISRLCVSRAYVRQRARVHAYADTRTNIVSTTALFMLYEQFRCLFSSLHTVSLHPSSVAAALLDGLRVIRALSCTRNSASKSWYVRTRLTRLHPPRHVPFIVPVNRFSLSYMRAYTHVRTYKRLKFAFLGRSRELERALLFSRLDQMEINEKSLDKIRRLILSTLSIVFIIFFLLYDHGCKQYRPEDNPYLRKK